MKMIGHGSVGQAINAEYRHREFQLLTNPLAPVVIADTVIGFFSTKESPSIATMFSVKDLDTGWGHVMTWILHGYEIVTISTNDPRGQA
jgi:hypothetical protein